MEPVAHIQFSDGPLRPVFEADGRQFIIDDDGNRAYGVWFIPRDEPVPFIVRADGFRDADHF